MIFGARVTIGPIIPSDIGRLFQWTDSAEDAHLNGTYRPPNWESQENFWLRTEDPASIFFAIRIQPSPEIAGYVQIRDIAPVHRSAKIGIWLGEAGDRGRGYGRDSLRLAIDYCWRQLNLRRLSLEVFAHNHAALRMYEALGFREEGVLREAQFIDGQWIDIILMALHRDPKQPE